MKNVLLLLTVTLLIGTSGAFAQGDACAKRYGVCMNHCAKRPNSIQEPCIKSCESQTNRCYEAMYGRPPAAASASALARGADAAVTAKDEKAPQK
jgi:hypothetical protein